MECINQLPQKQIYLDEKLQQTCLVQLERMVVFPCEICDTICSQLDSLTEHLITHVKIESTSTCIDSSPRHDQINCYSTSVSQYNEYDIVDSFATEIKKESTENVYPESEDVSLPVTHYQILYNLGTNTLKIEETEPHISEETVDRNTQNDIENIPINPFSETDVCYKSDGKLISCNFCGKHFSHDSFLREHKLKDHGIVVSGTEEIMHSCAICQKSYAQKEYLIKHAFSTHIYSKPIKIKVGQTKKQLQSRQQVHTDKRFKETYSSDTSNQKPGKSNSCGHKQLNNTITATENNRCGIRKNNVAKKLKNTTTTTEKQRGGKHNNCGPEQHNNRITTIKNQRCGKRKCCGPEHLNNTITTTGKPTCAICNRHFTEKNFLMRHILTVHMTTGYPCSICKKDFGHPIARHWHMATHSITYEGTLQKAIKYSCHICKKTFLKKTLLSNHLQLHTFDKFLKCEVCRKQFMFKSQLKTHQRTHTGEQPFSCSLCNVSFRYGSSLSHHKRSVHKMGQPICATCGMSFFDKTALLRHILRIHMTTGYPCSVCKLQFGHPIALDKHMALHRGTFKCTVCGKCFERKHHWQNHEFSHTKPFKCDKCGKHFGNKTRLGRHIAFVCLKTMPKNFECPICHMKTARKELLKRHMNKKTCKPKPYKCATCLLMYADLKSRDKHQKNCKKQEKRFKCDKCKNTFKTKHWMAAHIISCYNVY